MPDLERIELISGASATLTYSASGEARAVFATPGGEFELDAIVFGASVRATDIENALLRAPGAQLLVVPRLQPRIRQIAKDFGLHCLDRSGDGNVIDGRLVYLVERRGAEDARPAGASFAPRATDVIRWLLVHHGTDADTRTTPIARQLEMSAGQAHKILHGLEAERLVAQTLDGWAVVNPSQMLTDWARRGARPKSRASVSFRARMFIDDLLHDIGALNMNPGDAVLSGAGIGGAMAPYRPSDALQMYVFDEHVLEHVRKRFGEIRLERPASSDAPRTVFTIDLVRPQVGTGMSTWQGLPIAHPTQIYVDMARSRSARDQDAAEHFRRTVVKL